VCGIFGIVTEGEAELGPVLIEAAHRLSYRGYDSVGCATLHDDGTIDLRKDAGKVADVAERLQIAEMRGSRGMVQLRWATFGAPSQANAQPHLDTDGDLVGAHNGNVVNNVELRRQFIAEGMTVRSTNDGESCVHAVERHVDRGHSMVDAIRLAYQDLQGDYSFVIGRAGEHTLYAFKKGSGLVVGIADRATCVSSDLPSILPLTRRILRLQDGEIVVLRARSVEVRSVADGSVIDREVELVTQSMEAAEKGGYAHFMLKEIHEQPQVVQELLHLLEAYAPVPSILERLSSARHLYLLGCGTSYHACLLGSVYLARLAGRAAIPVLAPQFIPQYGPAVGPEDVGIFVSQSGETKDVLNALEVAQKRGMHTLGLVNVVGSTLSHESEFCLPMTCGYEISVPATKTFVNQMVTFLFLAQRLGGHSTSQLAILPGLLERTLVEAEPQVEALAGALAPHNDLYCLGYGLTYPIALEGALKLKEITYAHCEGALSTEFKHGPLSAVSSDFPVIFVVGPEDVPLLISGINETTCRGGRAIAIAQEDERLSGNVQDMVTLPPAGAILNPVLATLPLQMLSYRVSVLRGIDPDFPRNLSKTLTVD
jgi:glucosamine--fructose-6-phosphate aminotransferase (isomerizing)